MTDTIILDKKQIEYKTRRIAFQILEANVDCQKIVIAGINGNGFKFAQRIQKVLSDISSIENILCEVFINKKNPLGLVSTSVEKEVYKNQSLVLVDDVLNSGTTLIYGAKHFLNVPLKRFKIAVLVNRNHKKYPVKADFKGLSLSTTLQEHIRVSFDNNSAVAYLEG